ncbi:unnamed protein product [Nesidiocoris tenuis]|uniref:Uncharacterized protein n=1 Tax=Nesidiocoris tenuis TaxID=355587 RepID=A0A6H5GW55_9HEMI|nr:unnamed protein product [Nesidiocoris tenuis]CAB0007455.1 unnamed protein product [Nesidiocoris tenuis]
MKLNLDLKLKQKLKPKNKLKLNLKVQRKEANAAGHASRSPGGGSSVSVVHPVRISPSLSQWNIPLTSDWDVCLESSNRDTPTRRTGVGSQQPPGAGRVDQREKGLEHSRLASHVEDACPHLT